MAQTGCRLMARKRLQPLVWAVAFVAAAQAWAQDLAFSAKVDKTAVDAGESINLTITLSGEIGGLRLPTPQFPEEFAVTGRSQATNFSLRGGAMERSMSLVYALLPQRPGVFTLGPFKLEHRGKEFLTEPIEITVKKSSAPPSHFQPQGERFTL